MKKIPTSSFDVFDTLLVRVWARTLPMYEYIGEELYRRGLINIAAPNWAMERVKAEQHLWQRNYEKGAVELKDIYHILSHRLQWTEYAKCAAMCIEEQIEIDGLLPLKSNNSYLDQERSKRAAIIFLSDMHLSSSVIRKALEQHELCRDGDAVLASSCEGATKAGGRLFGKMISTISADKSLHTHYGDNYRVDVLNAEKAGLNAIHLRAGHLTNYEEAIADSPKLSKKFRSLLAGAMRLARTSVQHDDQHREIIQRVSANVVGPVLTGYVTWLVESAKKLRIERLYFLARDGQLPLKLALTAPENQQLDFRYLYASRQAWHLPSIMDVGKEELDWILDTSNRALSMKSISERLRFDQSKLKGLLNKSKFENYASDAPLTCEQLSSLEGEMLSNEELISHIKQLASIERSNAIAYLRQEGLYDSKRLAIVDTGWHGRLQRSFGRILRAAGSGREETLGFYFGLKKRLFDNGDFAEAFFDDCDGGKKSNLCNAPLIEIFTEANHGTTLGYQRDSCGKIIPVLKEKENSNAMNWGLDTQHDVAVMFSRHWNEIREKYHLNIEIEEWLMVVSILLEMFVFDPRPDEATVYGDFPKTSSQNHDDPLPLAPKISYGRGLMQSVVGNTMAAASDKTKSMLWLSGSLKRSNFDSLNKMYYCRKRMQWQLAKLIKT